jgi:hypothetical protein
MKRLTVIGLLATASVYAVLAMHRSQWALAASPARAPLVAMQFKPAIGWHVRQGKAHACPGVRATRCSQVTSLASTTRWRDCVECLPHRTLAGMAGDIIAIQITVAIEHPVRAVRNFAWPPPVSQANVNAGFEGLPNRSGVYQTSTLLGEREVTLFVWFGRRKPTARQLNRANTELRHTQLG